MQTFKKTNQKTKIMLHDTNAYYSISNWVNVIKENKYRLSHRMEHRDSFHGYEVWRIGYIPIQCRLRSPPTSTDLFLGALRTAETNHAENGKHAKNDEGLVMMNGPCRFICV